MIFNSSVYESHDLFLKKINKNIERLFATKIVSI